MQKKCKPAAAAHRTRILVCFARPSKYSQIENCLNVGPSKPNIIAKLRLWWRRESANDVLPRGYLQDAAKVPFVSFSTEPTSMDPER